MRKNLLLFCLLMVSLFCSAQNEGQSMEGRLFDFENIRFQKLDSPPGIEKYDLRIRQPLDHNDPDAGHFYQKVILEHHGYDLPVVMKTNGYALSKSNPEIQQLLNANLINIEHRFFGESIPKKMDWKYLTLEQVTADLHFINQLFKQVYHGKWISTGISKSGQTTIYYRYFYPDDVDVSIPYVAPVNRSATDPRIYKFLDSVGDDDCRSMVFSVQEKLLENKDWMLDRLKWFALAKEMTFNYFGSLEAAYELAVLEYPFSFWQNGSDCKTMPALEDKEALLLHFIDAVGLSLYEDKLVEYFAPHYYQAATEMGYYHLRTDGLEEYIDVVGDNPSAAFSPEGISVAYNPETNNKVQDWLATVDSDMIFIYGENDTWSATKADTPDEDNILYIIVDDEDHGGARMKNLSEHQWLDLVNYLKSRHGLVLKQ